MYHLWPDARMAEDLVGACVCSQFRQGCASSTFWKVIADVYQNFFNSPDKSWCGSAKYYKIQEGSLMLMYLLLSCVITVKWISQLGMSSNFGKTCSISCFQAICLHCKMRTWGLWTLFISWNLLATVNQWLICKGEDARSLTLTCVFFQTKHPITA